MNNAEAAARFSDEAIHAERQCGEYAVRPIISRAFIYGYVADFPNAERMFSDAIDRAFATGDLAAAASAWHLLGASYLKAAQDDAARRAPGTRARLLSRAEIAETEAFRLRELHHLTDLDQSLRDLGRIVAARGDLRTGGVLMEEAIAKMGDPHSTAPLWYFLRSRGQLLEMRGDLQRALTDFRAALELARRMDVVPTDDDRVTFESGLAELYSLFIDTGNRLYLQTRDPALLAEIFEASEENRAASLRALVPQPHDWRTRLPAEYGEVLAHLQQAERVMLASGGETSVAEFRRLSADLHDIEARAGAVDAKGNESALAFAKRNLDRDAAILAFHLGPQGSWVWWVTQDEFDVRPLPPQAELAEDAARFRQEIRNGDGGERGMGGVLGHILLDPLPESVHRKHRWIVELDGDLFDLPLAALQRNGQFLIEDHALLLTPGLRLPASRGSQDLAGGMLVGVGDAIYNQADARWPGSPGSRREGNSWDLARLPGSGEEVRAAVGVWGAGTVMTGGRSTRENLLQAIAGDPAILHLATHVIKSPVSHSSVIVLGLNAAGEPGFIDMRDILLHPITTRLVVMSGCASGEGAALPAGGLMGLTRAWLGAGAGEVLATRWPALDDSGLFFSSFYRNLRDGADEGAADALRKTQTEMIRSHSFRSNPAYWASYFLVGKIGPPRNSFL